MPSPDLIAPERLEQLLAGALPDTDREARVQGLALELRSSAAPAPESLRQRVRALPSPPPRRRLFPRRRLLSPRRLVAVLVPTCLVAAVAGALVFGNGSGGEDESGGAENRSGALYAPEESSRAEEPTPADSEESVPLQSIDAAASGRARDIDMWIELRVPNGDRLSESAEEAARITRELGGFVAASTVRTAGAEGRGELILRVPTANVDDAAFRLSELGTVTNQRVVTEDLQTELDGLARRIEAVGRAIRIAKLRLESGTLEADERLRIEIRLERLRAERAQLDRSRARVGAQAATAELTLVLHTRAAAAGGGDESGVGGAAKNALGFLAAAGSIAVFLAIVLSPLLVLAVFAWLALRAHARRRDAALLERPRPASPSPQPRN
jgi:hypothetical protein